MKALEDGPVIPEPYIPYGVRFVADVLGGDGVLGEEVDDLLVIEPVGLEGAPDVELDEGLFLGELVGLDNVLLDDAWEEPPARAGRPPPGGRPLHGGPPGPPGNVGHQQGCDGQRKAHHDVQGQELDVHVGVTRPEHHPFGGEEYVETLEPEPGAPQDDYQGAQYRKVPSGEGGQVEPVLIAHPRQHCQDGDQGHSYEGGDEGAEEPALEQRKEGDIEDVESHVPAEDGVVPAEGGPVQVLEDRHPPRPDSEAVHDGQDRGDGRHRQGRGPHGYVEDLSRQGREGYLPHGGPARPEPVQ